MTSRPPVLLGLGSNIGDREAALEGAVRFLSGRGFRELARSSLYLTEPVGGPPQGPYLNAVVRGETLLSPEELLRECLLAERAFGRVRLSPLGPRTLDVDLLLYGGEVRRTPQLTLPHPRLHERLFVLIPLCELVPKLRHPVLGLTVQQLLERCPDRSSVRRHAPSAGLA
jgi:2-amino-4-hydroxy-6-hydroxymethyldihydropteridine diphosphokinase